MKDQGRHLDLYCDGSSTNNAGPRSMARWVVAFKSGKKVVDLSGWGTNNEAEYKGFIAALNYVMLMSGSAYVVIHMDSELVFMQMTGKYQVKSERLKQLHEVAKKLMATTVTRVLSLELVLDTGVKNPAHITINTDTVPNVYNGIKHIVNLLPKYQEMLDRYNEDVDEQAQAWIDAHDDSRRPFDGEIRQEARQWLNKRGEKRYIGTLGALPSKKLVQSLYDTGAVLVEVVDPAVGGTETQPCDTLRVDLPFITSEDLKSAEAISADKAMACLNILAELECSVQQAWDGQTTFYVMW